MSEPLEGRRLLAAAAWQTLLDASRSTSVDADMVSAVSASAVPGGSTIAGAADLNDEITEAFSLGTVGLDGVNSTAFGGNISPSDDVDMLRITVAAGQRVGIDVDATSGVDTRIRLFDGFGSQLAVSATGRAPDETAVAANTSLGYIEYTFGLAGNYFIGIGANNNSNYSALNGTNDIAGGSTGAYTVYVSNRFARLGIGTFTGASYPQTIYFDGTSGADYVAIDTTSDGTARLDLNHRVLDFVDGTTTAINIDAGSGNDSIYFDGVGSAADPFQFSVSATGSAGDDLLQIGNDLDSDIFGNVTLSGGSGTNRINVEDDADSSFPGFGGTYTLSPLGADFLIDKPGTAMGSIAIDAQSICGVYIYGANANYDWNINSVGGTTVAPPLTALVLDGGTGNNAFRFSPASQDLDGTIFGTVDIVGDITRNSVFFNDQNDSGIDTYTVATTATGSSFEKNVAAFGKVNLQSAMKFVTINGNNGNGTYVIGSDLDLIAQNIVVNQGPATLGTLQVSDTADFGDDQYNLNTGFLGKPSAGNFVQMTYSGFDRMSLVGNLYNNSFWLYDKPAATAMTLAGQNGNDNFYLSDTAGDLDNVGGILNIDGGAGEDKVQLNDANDTGNDNYVLGDHFVDKPTGGGLFDLLRYSNLENLLLYANNGNNDIFVGGQDLDDRLAAYVLVDAGGGDDDLFIEDQADNAGNDTLTIGGSSVDKGLSNLVVFSDNESLTLYGSPQPTTYNVGYNFRGPLYVNGGGGSDLFNITPTVVSSGGVATGGDFDNLSGRIVLNGGGGTDAAVADDRRDAIGAAYTDNYEISNTELRKPSNAEAFDEITLNGMENLRLLASNAANKIVVLVTAVGDVTVDGQGGNDDIFVQGNTTNVFTGAGQDYLTVTGSATAVFSTYEEVANVELVSRGRLLLAPNGVSTLVVSGQLNIPTAGTASARLDVNNNKVIWRNAVANANVVAGQLRDGAMNNWAGSQGIVSTAASTLPSNDTGLGYAIAGEVGLTSIGGVSLGSNDLVIDYTYEGDANLDQRVDVADLGLLAASFRTSTNRWSRGDFNYDNVVDVADLGILAANFRKGPLAVIVSTSMQTSWSQLEELYDLLQGEV